MFSKKLRVVLLCATLSVSGYGDSDTFIQDVRTSGKEQMEEYEQSRLEEKKILIDEYYASLEVEEETEEETEDDAIDKAIEKAIKDSEESLKVYEAQAEQRRSNWETEELLRQVSKTVIGNSHSQPTVDAEYYDIQVPYLTARDIGGYAVEVDTNVARYRFTAETYDYADNKIGCKILMQSSRTPSKLAKTVYDSVTDSWLLDCEEGLRYAITLPKGYFPDAMVDIGFYPWAKLSDTGIYADLILDDGTVIPCVVIDGINTVHSNGTDIKDGWTATAKSRNNDYTRYRLAELRLPQYEAFFHAAGCYAVEYFGNASAFMDRYNICVDGSGRYINFIRVYRKKLG